MTENRTYTEADLQAVKREWEQQHAQSDLVKEVAAIKGQLSGLPALMDATARRVVAEIKAADAIHNGEQRAQRLEQRSEHTWGRAPAIIQMGQFITTIVLAALAYFAGKGHLP